MGFNLIEALEERLEEILKVLSSDRYSEVVNSVTLDKFNLSITFCEGINDKKQDIIGVLIKGGVIVKKMKKEKKIIKIKPNSYLKTLIKG